MKANGILAALCLCLLAACAPAAEQPQSTVPSAAQQEYTQITAAQAKEKMDALTEYILLDVRTQEEYDEGHIAGAMLIPDTEIAARAEAELPDKAATILIYCRSGRRSKLAAQTLAELSYQNVFEFGGIVDWPYEIVS